MDYFSEIRLKLEGNLKFIIFQQILNELEAKRKGEPKATQFIRLLDSGLSYVEKNKTEYEIATLKDIKKSTETTDEFLIQKSLELKEEGYNIFLATNDSELRRRSKKLGISVIFLRQKKYLSIERT